ncbi:MAG: hypothetical protein K6G91_06990 [Kiritimatiellae bacterium]|nr:hypothetical protein [Kiritimatiellia bacterium]
MSDDATTPEGFGMGGATGEAKPQSQSAALMANIVARRYGASSAFVVARKRNGHAGRMPERGNG